MTRHLIAGALLAAVAATASVSGAQAQGTVPGAAAGAATGAAAGNSAAGPVGGVVGGVVGGAVGAATGTVGGVLGVDLRPKFRTYALQRGVASYSYAEPLRVGAVLPATGVTYYEVPTEYGVTGTRYTIVNNTPVLVDPGTHRIVEVVN